jgi:hypothetical protein
MIRRGKKKTIRGIRAKMIHSGTHYLFLVFATLCLFSTTGAWARGVNATLRPENGQVFLEKADTDSGLRVRSMRNSKVFFAVAPPMRSHYPENHSLECRYSIKAGPSKKEGSFDFKKGPYQQTVNGRALFSEKEIIQASLEGETSIEKELKLAVTCEDRRKYKDNSVFEGGNEAHLKLKIIAP